MFGSCRCVNCVVYPRTGDPCPGLVGVSIVLCMYPRTGDLCSGIAGVSIVLCIHTLVNCVRVLQVCQLCCVSTHWRPVFGSCRCVNCVVYPRTGDLCSGLAGVSIVLCIHTLETCFQVL